MYDSTIEALRGDATILLHLGYENRHQSGVFRLGALVGRAIDYLKADKEPVMARYVVSSVNYSIFENALSVMSEPYRPNVDTDIKADVLDGLLIDTPQDYKAPSNLPTELLTAFENIRQFLISSNGHAIEHKQTFDILLKRVYVLITLMCYYRFQGDIIQVEV